MRSVLSATVAVLLGAITVPGFQGGTSGDAAPRRGPILQWDHSGKDVDGNPETLDHADIALTDLKTDLQEGGKPAFTARAPIQKGANEADLGILFAGDKPGTYRVWVRAVDASGNVSAWAGPVEATLAAPVEKQPEAAPGSKEPAGGGAGAQPASRKKTANPEIPVPPTGIQARPRGKPPIPEGPRGGGCRLL